MRRNRFKREVLVFTDILGKNKKFKVKSKNKKLKESVGDLEYAFLNI